MRGTILHCLEFAFGLAYDAACAAKCALKGHDPHPVDVGWLHRDRCKRCGALLVVALIALPTYACVASTEALGYCDRAAELDCGWDLSTCREPTPDDPTDCDLADPEACLSALEAAECCADRESILAHFPACAEACPQMPGEPLDASDLCDLMEELLSIVASRTFENDPVREPLMLAIEEVIEGRVIDLEPEDL